jgi:hypothetical protein
MDQGRAILAEKPSLENRAVGETGPIQGTHGSAKDLASKFRNLKQHNTQQSPKS